VPIVARLIVGADEPGVRIVEARLGDVDDRHRNARTRARTAIRLTEIGPPRLLDPLQLAVRVRQASLGEEIRDVAPAALEHAEDVAGLERLPIRQRIDLRHDARDRRRVHEGIGNLRAFQNDRFAVAAVGLAEDVLLEVENAVVVRRTAPEHDRRRMQAAHRGLDDVHVAGTARFPRNAIVGRIDEADELGAFAIEQRERTLRICARGVVPRFRETRQHVRGLECLLVVIAAALRAARHAHAAVAAVTIGAAQLDRGIQVHRACVGLRVARQAARALRLNRFVGLTCRRRRSDDVLALDGVLGLGGGKQG
jgi:hypothetical protein